MKVAFDDEAFQEYQSWAAKGTIKTLERINKLIDDCCRSPYDGIGKPERLRGDLSGLWSRRIDQERRLVYTVQDDADDAPMLLILRCRGHYD